MVKILNLCFTKRDSPLPALQAAAVSEKVLPAAAAAEGAFLRSNDSEEKREKKNTENGCGMTDAPAIIKKYDI
jgi:hypothetical protein